MNEKTKKTEMLILTAVIIFFAGCIIGWGYEMLFYRIDRGEFIKRGQGIGPWLPIYGFGALLLYVTAYRFKKSKAAVFGISIAVTGVLEFVTGWVLYNFFDRLRLWDYNTEIWNWGNIGGYVCLRSVLVFGAAGLFLVYLIIPALEKFITEKNIKVIKAVTAILSFLFLLDFSTSYVKLVV